MRRPVQPARDRIVFPDRAGLPRQSQEGHLEGVLGLVRIVQDAPADAQHHRPVPLHQRAEGRLAGLITARHEPFQQLGIGQPADRPDPEQRLEMPEQLARSPASHAAVTPLTWPGLTALALVVPARTAATTTFFAALPGIVVGGIERPAPIMALPRPQCLRILRDLRAWKQGGTSRNRHGGHPMRSASGPRRRRPRRAARLHPDRAPGGALDHRHPDRALDPGGASGARGGAAAPVHQQPEAARAGGGGVRVGQRLPAARLPAAQLADQIGTGRIRTSACSCACSRCWNSRRPTMPPTSA